MEHKFVEFLPSSLEQDILYVSLEYKTVAHLCCCGCGNEVITPITPTDWTFSYNGKGVSLHPSIGNWNFDCKSHYWIKENKIVWAGDWNENMIQATQKNDIVKKQKYYAKEEKENTGNRPISTKEKGAISSIIRIFSKWLN